MVYIIKSKTRKQRLKEERAEYIRNEQRAISAMYWSSPKGNDGYPIGSESYGARKEKFDNFLKAASDEDRNAVGGVLNEHDVGFGRRCSP